MWIEQALAQGTAAQSQGESWFSLLFLSFVFVLFYFLLIRPQRKKQKEHEMMVQGLEKGDEVIAAGGLYGEITHVSQDHVRLRLADNVEVRAQRYAVNALLPKGTLKISGKKKAPATRK